MGIKSRRQPQLSHRTGTGAGGPSVLQYPEQLDKTQRYGFFFRVTTAKKPEPRQKRIADFVALLKRRETLH